MDLEPAVVNTCLGIRETENVVVVADEGTRAIGEAMLDAARLVGRRFPASRKTCSPAFSESRFLL